MWEVREGDCLALMREMPDNSVDACIVDPPYGLGTKEPDIARVMAAWIAGETAQVNNKDFMGKDWQLPGPEYWREVYRVMKPGAHLLCFAGTKGWDLMSIAIRFAGFENRDTIAHNFAVPAIQWAQGQGFPKGLDVSAAIDKLLGAEREVVGRKADYTKYNTTLSSGSVYEMAGNRLGREKVGMITTPATDDAARFSGYNVALKPSWECILVFRKPLSEPNVASNVLRWGCGGLNIDATRVRTNGEAIHVPQSDPTHRAGTVGTNLGISSTGVEKFQQAQRDSIERTNSLGRWPTNLVLSHSPFCRRVGVKRVKGVTGGFKAGSTGAFGKNSIYGEAIGSTGTTQYAEPDGTEQVDEYICVEGCVVRLLDEQVGHQKSGGTPHSRKAAKTKNAYGEFTGEENPEGIGASSGNVSRFFPQFQPDIEVPFLYCAKASTRERSLGCENLPAKKAGVGDDRPSGDFQERHNKPPVQPRGNNHPTTKPLSLMRFLCKLATPPGGVILDPFGGSGTTGCAAVLEGFDCILCEREPDYVEIARARISYWEKEANRAKEQPTLFELDRAESA